MFTKNRTCRRLTAAALCFCGLPVMVGVGGVAKAVGFGPGDILISGYNTDNIAVFTPSFNFAGYLETGFNQPSGMDLDADGNLVVVGDNPDAVRVYSPDGNLVPNTGFSFSNINLRPIDVKVEPGGDYYIGTQSDLRRYRDGGTFVNALDTGDYESVVVLPSGVIWGGGTDRGRGIFNSFSSGGITALPRDNGQVAAASMTYLPESQTVLVVDGETDRVFERDTSGAFVRSFETDTRFEMGSATSAARDTAGRTLTTDFSDDGVYIFEPDGTYSFRGLSGLLDGPTGILVVPAATQAMLAGDYNGSGQVEQGDLNLVLNNWGGPRGAWDNADGFASPNVDQEELNGVLNNWGDSGVAPSFEGFAVPEPALLGWAGLAMLVPLRRRRGA